MKQKNLFLIAIKIKGPNIISLKTDKKFKKKFFKYMFL